METLLVSRMALILWVWTPTHIQHLWCPTGLVHYWHTPFGDLQPWLHTDLGPVYMQHKGNLVLSNISRVHSGLYYCLLQHTGGITLSLHQLRVKQESSSCDEHSSRGARRPRRDVGSAAERQVGLSDWHFTGAVVGSVLLTFVVGFSAGALCRSQVLRSVHPYYWIYPL